MRLKKAVSLAVLILGFGCATRPVPTPIPEAASIQTLAERESDPRRAASLRLVETARSDLAGERFERAARNLSRAIEIDPGDPYAYFYLGVARYRVGRFPEAGELFGRAAGLFGDLNVWRSEALAFRGECLERTGRPADAQAAFEEARTVDPGNARANEGLSRLSGHM